MSSLGSERVYKSANWIGQQRRVEAVVELNVLDLSETVDHESDELNTSESCNLVLGLEALEEEREELSDQTRRGTVVLVFLVFLLTFLQLKVCGKKSISHNVTSIFRRRYP